MSELDVAVSKAVKAEVEKIRRMMVPRHCFTCRFFILRTEKPRNRVCRFEGKLKVEKGQCLSWELEPDASKWVHNKNMGA